MKEYSEIQKHIDEVTMTTAEKRHDQQRKAAARRLQQMEYKRQKDEKRKAFDDAYVLHPEGVDLLKRIHAALGDSRE